MGYIERWVGDWIYTAIGGRWGIYSDGWEMGYIQLWGEMGYIPRCVGDGIYKAMGGRMDI